MHKDSKIYVAGHRGMVGSAIVRRLATDGYKNITVRTSSELDLRNQQAVEDFFDSEKPEYVFLAAAKVGGIMANNTYRADFLYENLMIESNVIHQAYVHKVKKLLFLGSSCIYPKLAPQPLQEDTLLSGFLEPTNEPYAIAKIAGIKLCESYRLQYGCDFISAMPTNLYGPNDNYDLNTSHVIPALVRKFDEAKKSGARSVVVWGSGTPLREFLHVDDLAEACFFLMRNYSELQFVNVGTGKEISIGDLALLLKKIVGFEGEIVFDKTKPDGTPRKLMDNSKLYKMGWQPSIGLEEGLRRVHKEEFVSQPL
jgi:GDP-L-fucose synthase